MTAVATKGLTQQQIWDICQLIIHWEHKLTWQRLVETIRNELGFYISRQSLVTYFSIKNEFDLKKNELKSGVPTARLPAKAKEVDLLKKIERLEKTVAQLTKERDIQLNTIETILKNASEMNNVGLEGIKLLMKPRS